MRLALNLHPPVAPPQCWIYRCVCGTLKSNLFVYVCKIFFKELFYVYVCFACMHVCALRVNLVPVEDRRMF